MRVVKERERLLVDITGNSEIVKLPRTRRFDIILSMKSNNTTTKSTNSSITLRARFTLLKTLWHQAPLSKVKLEELKTLAKKFDPKMAKYMEENPQMC